MPSQRKKASQTITVPVRLMIVSWTIENFCVHVLCAMEFDRAEIGAGCSSGAGVKILILSVWFSIWAFLKIEMIGPDGISCSLPVSVSGYAFFIVSLQFAQWFL